MAYEWREIKPGQWWHLSKDAPVNPRLPDLNNVYHPPDMVIEWVGFPTACCHLYMYNGSMPGENYEDDCDYVHICDPKDFIKNIQQWIDTANYVGEEELI